MKLSMMLAGLAAPALFAATPAAAQNYPMTQGDYQEVVGIDLEDGGAYEYATWLAGQWRKNQEFAKQKGWIKSYEVLTNVNSREGEPDLWLVTRFASLPDAAEDERRQEEYRKMMRQTDRQLEAASGDRGKFRKVKSSILMRELRFK